MIATGRTGDEFRTGRSESKVTLRHPCPATFFFPALDWALGARRAALQRSLSEFGNDPGGEGPALIDGEGKRGYKTSEKAWL